MPTNNGRSLFVGKSGTTYDGTADIVFIAIPSFNGNSGSAHRPHQLLRTKGMPGVFAPGVAFTGPVFVGDIDASATATPVLIIGSSSDTRITPNLRQTNSQAVRVSGLTQLKFTAGIDANGNNLSAKNNLGVLRDSSSNADVTISVVVNP